MALGFLDIPRLVRHEIYRLAEFPVDSVLHLQYVNEKIDLAADMWLAHHKFSQYLRTRCTNQAVADDAMDFLCANNQVMLCCAQEYNLNILMSIVPRILKHLRQFTIHLNLSYDRYKKGEILENTCRPNCDHYAAPESHVPGSMTPGQSERMQPPLSVRHSGSASLIKKWQKAINRLSSLPSNTLSELRLVLIADVADIETSAVLSATMQQLSLGSCSVRFGAWHDGENDLCHAALKVVARATDDPRLKAPFRFLDLLPEQQLHVLSYTDLVTPNRQVHWLGESGYWAPQQNLQCELHDVSMCSLHFAVYPPCTCWRSPKAMLSVSRQVRQLAREVFYSSNRFIFADNGTTEVMELFFENPPRRPPMQSAARLASSWLLRTLPFDALDWIREIELIFNDFGRAEEYMNDEVLTLWSNTMSTVGPKFRHLSFRIYVSTGHHWGEWYEGAQDYGPNPHAVARWKLHDKPRTQLLASHRDFLQPLAKLESLHRLSVFIAPPWCHSLPPHPRYTHVYTQLNDHAASLRREALGSRAEKCTATNRSGFVSQCLIKTGHNPMELSNLIDVYI